MLILDDAADPEASRQRDDIQARIAVLEKLNSTDILTGAWNRRHYDRIVGVEQKRSMRFRQPVSLLFFDIDHFKEINDTFGHQTGDSVLRELVELVGTTIRSIDTLFRWGGEEFVILASSTDYREGAVFAERIRSKVEQHRFAGIVAPMTISVGTAEHIAGESTETWFHRVDSALYRAKKDGRNRVNTDRRGSSDLWAAESGLSTVRLVWQEDYECGEPTIDSEHRALFDQANALFDASFKSKTSTDAFNAASEKMLANLARHFAHEESLLAEHGYKDVAAHRLAHASLLARAAEIGASVAAGATTLEDLVEYLANTVVAGHIFGDDKKYFPLFRNSVGQ